MIIFASDLIASDILREIEIKIAFSSRHVSDEKFALRSSRPFYKGSIFRRVPAGRTGRNKPNPTQGREFCVDLQVAAGNLVKKHVQVA
jgi:hypothetical protein